MMTVKILTEGGYAGGFGHITRCTSFMDAFAEKGMPVELIVEGDDSVKDFLGDKGCKFIHWTKEQEKILNIIDADDILIIDSYKADASVYYKIVEKSKTVVYLDDTNRLDYPKGFVVNGALIARNLGYPVKPDVQYLIGPHYQILRKEFWGSADFSVRPTVKSIMVTFGGSDMRNLTPAVLQLLCSEYPECRKNIIIGVGFEGKTTIEKHGDSNTNYYFFPTAKTMKDVMVSSDLAIASGGQTLYELACIGLPTIAVLVADNQKNNIVGWKEAGFVEYAGDWDSDSLFQNLSTALIKMQRRKIRSRMSKAGRKIIDGLGVKRVVTEVLDALGLSCLEGSSHVL